MIANGINFSIVRFFASLGFISKPQLVKVGPGGKTVLLSAFRNIGQESPGKFVGARSRVVIRIYVHFRNDEVRRSVSAYQVKSRKLLVA